MNSKNLLEEYTEEEFLQLIEELFCDSRGLDRKSEERYMIALAEHIVKISEHPEKSDLLFYPPAGREDSPTGILNEIKDWRAKNGKPGFKEN